MTEPNRPNDNGEPARPSKDAGTGKPAEDVAEHRDPTPTDPLGLAAQNQPKSQPQSQPQSHAQPPSQTQPYPPYGQAGTYRAAPFGSNESTPGGPPVHNGEQHPGQTRSRRTGVAAAATVLALVVGGISGGLGGVVGYNLADRDSASASALDAAKPAARQASNAPDGSAEQVAAKVLPSVVQIEVRGSTGAGEGSGIVLSEDGLILTNNHVVEAAADGGELTVVFNDGRRADASIVGRAPSSDLAVIKAADVSGLTPAELGRSDDLAVGQQVVAIGSPLGLSGTVTTGIVSSLDRPVRAGGESSDQTTVLDAIQTDAAINPGNSGGPLVDDQGRVIGINSAIASLGSGEGQSGSIGLGFAIPIDQARRIADELTKNGKATQAVLGVSVAGAQGQATESGATVARVEAGSAAEQAGIKAGEVITKIDDRAIEDSDELVAAVRSHAPGDTVKIEVGDGQNQRTIDVTLGSRTIEANG